MQKFQMSCSCGDKIEVEASSREEAVQKMKALMTSEEVAKHFAQKHPDQEVPGIDLVHQMLEQMVAPVES